MRGRILIVDDSPTLVRTLATDLIEAGYAVETATSTEEALSKLNGVSFDLAIIDIRLPRVSGLELLCQIKRDNPALAAIIITAYESLDTAVRSMRAGAWDYFVKPLNLDELKESIGRFFQNRPAPSL